MCGAMRFSNSWLMRSFTRHAFRSALASSTGSRVLREPDADAAATVAFGVAARDVARETFFFFGGITPVRG
jgi:hypothetical protein